MTFKSHLFVICFQIQCFLMGIFGTLYVLVHFARIMETFYIAHIGFKTILKLVNLVLWATESANHQNMWHLSITLYNMARIRILGIFCKFVLSTDYHFTLLRFCRSCNRLFLSKLVPCVILGFRLPQKCVFPCNLLKYLTPMNYLMKQPVLCFSNALGL